MVHTANRDSLDGFTNTHFIAQQKPTIAFDAKDDGFLLEVEELGTELLGYVVHGETLLMVEGVVEFAKGGLFEGRRLEIIIAPSGTLPTEGSLDLCQVKCKCRYPMEFHFVR